MFIHQYFNFTVKQAGVAVAGVSYSGTTATLFLQQYLQQTLVHSHTNYRSKKR
jgi:hypothetical protein